MEDNEYEAQWAEGEEKKEIDADSAALIESAKADEKSASDEYSAAHKELEASK